MGIKEYRMMANAVLRAKHGEIEYGLRKTAEQECFVHAVAEKLSHTQWVYRVRMDKNFDITFVLEAPAVKAAAQLARILQAYFDVESENGCLYVSDCNKAWLQCCITFGECS